MKTLIIVLLAAFQLIAANDTTTYTYVRKSDTTCKITLKLFNVRPWTGIGSNRAVKIDYRTTLSKPATQWCYNSQVIKDEALVYLSSNGCPNGCPYNVPAGQVGCSAWDSGTFTQYLQNTDNDSMAVLSVSIQIYKWVGGGTFNRCDTGKLVARYSWMALFSDAESRPSHTKKSDLSISIYDVTGRFLGRSTAKDGMVAWQTKRPGIYFAKYTNGLVKKFVKM
jgi:hypothetical protein